MADKRIQDLPRLDRLVDEDIVLVGDSTRNFDAYGMTGFAFRKFGETAGADAGKEAAEEATKIGIEKATAQADRAKNEADRSEREADRANNEANRSKDEADNSKAQAERAKTFSGKVPKIIDGIWYIWDEYTNKYISTGQTSVGDVSFATFAIIPDNGNLYMYTPDKYSGADFQLTEKGYLEVII